MPTQDPTSLFPNHEDRDAFFRDITERVCGTLSLNEGLQQALPKLARYIPVDVIQLTVMTPDKSSVRSIAWAQPNGPARAVLGSHHVQGSRRARD